ncbi:MAG TPA: hypothetical protein VIS96_03695 [Terrimicrobiaceae bacterium]
MKAKRKITRKVLLYPDVHAFIERQARRWHVSFNSAFVRIVSAQLKKEAE